VCEESGLPFARIQTPSALFDDPHLNAGGMVPVTLPNGDETRIPGLPIQFGAERLAASLRLADTRPTQLPDSRRDQMIRRAFLALALTIVLPTVAQDYPSKPVKLIVPVPSGGRHRRPVARGRAGDLEPDARPTPSSSTTDPARVATSASRPPRNRRPDGYTIAMGQTANLAVNPALYTKMPFDPLKDFAPIALVSSQPLIVVVVATSPYKTFKELVDASKKESLNMASAGNGTIGHIAGELFQRRAGVKWTHVPYKGAGPAVTDMLGGASRCSSRIHSP
jgi:tripartite-type tricarboxylate transporter receptor subunit TctC